MGFFKKIGKGISRAAKKVGKGIGKALSSPIGKIATTALQFVPGVGPITKILGAGVGLLQKGINPLLGGKSKKGAPLVGDAGSGAKLWKFSTGKDRWSEVKGTPLNIEVEGLNYTWNGMFYETATNPGNAGSAGVGGFSKDDVRITYEMLDGNLHFITRSRYRGDTRQAHGLYLAAREVFGSENNVIEGIGASAKAKKWKNEIENVEKGRDEDALKRIVNITAEDLMNGGTGYLDENSKKQKGILFKTFYNKKNYRKVIEEGTFNNNVGTINYDDLLYNMTLMDAQKSFIMKSKSKIKSALMKAWMNEPGNRRKDNKKILDRTPAEWKRDIDKVIRGNGINKSTSSNIIRNFYGANNRHNLEWIDLMRLLNQTARAQIKTGQPRIPKMNGKL
jgi:hypothetical protein